MGLRNRLKGLRSIFSRAVRRVRAFFGWEEGREQATSVAALSALAVSQEEADDKRGDGSGATVPIWLGPDDVDASECASLLEREDHSEYKNYADEATVRKARERKREQELEEDLVPDEDEERRDRLNRQKVCKLQEQLERTQHQQRIIANARAARARRALTEQELEARLEEIREELGDDGRPDGPSEGGGPEFC